MDAHPERVRLDRLDHVGATYYFRRKTAVIDASQWQQPEAEWIWNACHELRHPHQTTPFFTRWRVIKSLAEGGLGLGIILSIWSFSLLSFGIVVTLSAGFYALADLIPELDAVNHTSEMLETVLMKWPADSKAQAVWCRLIPQAIQGDTLTYIRNTSIMTFSLWAITLLVGLLLHALFKI